MFQYLENLQEITGSLPQNFQSFDHLILQRKNVNWKNYAFGGCPWNPDGISLIGTDYFGVYVDYEHNPHTETLYIQIHPCSASLSVWLYNAAPSREITADGFIEQKLLQRAAKVADLCYDVALKACDHKSSSFYTLNYSDEMSPREIIYFLTVGCTYHALINLNNRNEISTFLQTTHPRLGSNSPFHTLPEYLRKEVADKMNTGCKEMQQLFTYARNVIESSASYHEPEISKNAIKALHEMLIARYNLRPEAGTSRCDSATEITPAFP